MGFPTRGSSSRHEHARSSSGTALGNAAAVLSLVFVDKDKDKRGGLRLEALCLCLCYEMRAGDVGVEGYAGGWGLACFVCLLLCCAGWLERLV